MPAKTSGEPPELEQNGRPECHGAVLRGKVVKAFLVLRPSVAAQDRERPPRVKWEYKTAAEDKLNELGDQGWEVIAVTGGQPYIESSHVAPPALAVPGAPKEITTNKVKFAPGLYHLKRPK